MKKLFILAAASLMCSAAIAQTETATNSTTSSGLRWGARAGVNLSKYSFGKDDADNPTSSTVVGYHVTGYLDAKLAGPISIQPGLSLQNKGGEWELPGAATNEYEQNTMWIEVPVNFVGKIPLGTTGTNFFLGAGPYAAFAIAGEQKTVLANVTTESDLKFGSGTGKDLKNTDFGVNLLGGFQLGNGFNLGAGYGLGLSDLRPSGNGDEGQQNNRVLSFSVGYSF